jgi:hypothetical protein
MSCGCNGERIDARRAQVALRHDPRRGMHRDEVDAFGAVADLGAKDVAVVAMEFRGEPGTARGKRPLAELPAAPRQDGRRHPLLRARLAHSWPHDDVVAAAELSRQRRDLLEQGDVRVEFAQQGEGRGGRAGALEVPGDDPHG